MGRGARGIRFEDPVFNANPAFQNLVTSLHRLNRKGKLTFFAEVQADLFKERMASRRVFVLLKPSGRYSRSWIETAEALLEDHFY